MDILEILFALGKCVFLVAFLFQILPLQIWLERKGMAYIQDRPGPNRAEIFGVRLAGMVHTISDVLKLLYKENITPNHVFNPFYKLAPIISMTIALLTFVVIPFCDDIEINGTAYSMAVAPLDSGFLFTMAVGSLGVYGIMLAGWASNNKYALLGGVRSSAQMISYEIAMGLSVAAMLLLYGYADPSRIVADQGSNILNWGIFRGGAVVGLTAFTMFLISAFAETNRTPFDLPEGDSELVAGFHTEYSGLKFAMFYMAEYVNITVACGVLVTLFLGGYQIPFLSTETIIGNAPIIMKIAFGGGGVFFLILSIVAFTRYKPNVFGDNRDYEPLVVMFILIGMGVVSIAMGFIPDYSQNIIASIATAILQISVFTAKVLFFCWFFVWVRFTIPRFRYDQLMKLGWNYLLPIGFFNLMLAGIYVVATY